jgi:hypothetical protein
MKKPEGFMIFHEWLMAFEMLDDASVKELIIAMVKYSESGTEPSLEGAAKLAFAMMSRAIDRGHASYAETCERNRKNAEKRWE